MCKGADSVIEERLSAQSKGSKVFNETKKCVDLCAEEGLRTLFLAEKVIDPAEFEQWYKKAQ
jgi:phospholipid-translocating ATPase